MQKTKCVLIHKCQSIQKCNLIMYVQSNIQGIQMQQQLVNKSSYINNWSLRILNDKKILFIYSFCILTEKNLLFEPAHFALDRYYVLL